MKTARTSTLQDYKNRVLRVLVHIQAHLDEELGVEELAQVACFSPYHFHRIFRGMVGESLKEYVRRLRLERAAGHLKLGAAPVTTIALDAGYETHEAFTRAFRVTFGVAPSWYRKSRALLRTVSAPSGMHYTANGSRPATFQTQPKGPGMDVTIKKLQAMRVAFMRHVGPYAKVGSTWDKLLPYLGKEGFLGGKVMFIGICHDDPDVTVPSKIRYDACVTVDDTFTPIGEIGVQMIAGGEFGITTHFGPYSKLGKTYTRLLGEWLPRSGRALRDAPCFEVYLNSPQETDPSDLLTDVYAPLR